MPPTPQDPLYLLKGKKTGSWGKAAGHIKFAAVGLVVVLENGSRPPERMDKAKEVMELDKVSLVPINIIRVQPQTYIRPFYFILHAKY